MKWHIDMNGRSNYLREFQSNYLLLQFSLNLIELKRSTEFTWNVEHNRCQTSTEATHGGRRMRKKRRGVNVGNEKVSSASPVSLSSPWWALQLGRLLDPSQMPTPAELCKETESRQTSSHLICIIRSFACLLEDATHCRSQQDQQTAVSVVFFGPIKSAANCKSDYKVNAPSLRSPIFLTEMT